MGKQVDIVIIGAGASGCFTAIQALEHNPLLKIIILEKSNKVLAKVKISGGGRCNVTNVISNPAELSKNYPRGERFLKKAFHEFSSKNMIDWLEKKGIACKLYEDGCYFPVSNDSQTIIDCFLTFLSKHNVEIQTSSKVEDLRLENATWKIQTNDQVIEAKSVVVAIGGSPKQNAFDFLKNLEINYISPVPSLFTFNLPSNPISELMGIVHEARVRISNEKQFYDGPLLITHWGMSGPAVLKSSAFGARILAEKEYLTGVSVDWTNGAKQVEIDFEIAQLKKSTRMLKHTALYGIKQRLWDFLLLKIQISNEKRGVELSAKDCNRLKEILCNDSYQMEGKTTFKEEFVTSGGIDLAEIDGISMQFKKYKNLFAVGEALNIDGITGGFNFQSAWTSGYIAGKYLGQNNT